MGLKAVILRMLKLKHIDYSFVGPLEVMMELSSTTII